MGVGETTRVVQLSEEKGQLILRQLLQHISDAQLSNSIEGPPNNAMQADPRFSRR